MRFEHQLADALEGEASAYASGIVAEIRAQVPALFAAPALAALAGQGVEALIREFAVALRLERQDGFHAPLAAVAYAERLAGEGVPLIDVLRSYRLGQEAAFARAAELTTDAAALARVGALTFRFTDAVMAEATAAYERERDLRAHRTAARREHVVAQLLAGADLDRSAAEATLGYRLDGEHQAVVGIGDVDLAAVLGGRPLVAGSGAWVREPLDLGALRARLGDGRIAIGAPGPFLRTRRQAERAAALADVASDAILDYRELALPALLLTDRAAAADYAAERLGPLAAAPELCDTVTAFLDAGHDHTATAARLGVHRNTVARRLAEAERLAGRPVTDRVAELRAALLIAAATR